jgi:hypothetical protein
MRKADRLNAAILPGKALQRCLAKILSSTAWIDRRLRFSREERSTMKVFLLGGLAILAAVSAARAQGEPPQLEVGALYDKVRPELLRNLAAQGYRPRPDPEARKALCARDAALCKKYPELEDCAGTGLGLCRMVFSPGRGGFVVITAGEKNERRVFRFAHER